MLFVKKYKNAEEEGNHIYINLAQVCWFDRPYNRKTETSKYSIDESCINVCLFNNGKKDYFQIKDISMEGFALDVENAMRALSRNPQIEIECSNAFFTKNIDLEN